MTDKPDKSPKALWPGARFTERFERGVLVAVQLLLMVLILITVVSLFWLLWRGIQVQWQAIDDVSELQKALQRGFAGILLVLIGLELLETLRAYLHDRHVRLEVVLLVAVIALGRHIIQLDVEHMPAASLLGIAALMIALTGGYYLIRRLAAPGRARTETLSEDEDLQ